MLKELVDIIMHRLWQKKCMMFLGDHWLVQNLTDHIYETIELDAVVGSVGDGVTNAYDF